MWRLKLSYTSSLLHASEWFIIIVEGLWLRAKVFSQRDPCVCMLRLLSIKEKRKVNSISCHNISSSCFSSVSSTDTNLKCHRLFVELSRGLISRKESVTMSEEGSLCSYHMSVTCHCTLWFDQLCTMDLFINSLLAPNPRQWLGSNISKEPRKQLTCP